MQAPTVTEIAGSAAKETKTRFYRPELDVLRFLAFFLVFVSHALAWTDPSSLLLRGIKFGAVMGVPVFFCLSAYLITELLLREKDKTQTVSISSFYGRRILRIWPLYFAALFVGFMICPMISNQKITVAALLSYIFLAGNWYTYFHGYLPEGLSVLWSIGVEEQFYLVWPSIIRYLNRRSIVMTACLMWLISLVSAMWLNSRPVVSPYIWVNTLPHLQYFAIGALISVGFRKNLPRIHRYLRPVLIVAALALFLFVIPNWSIMTLKYGTPLATACTGHLIGGAACAFLLIGILGAKIPARMNFLVYLGKISYGLYVYHLWCLKFVMSVALHELHIKQHPIILTFGFALPLAILVSAISYRYFESPFLRLKERLEIIQSRAV